MRLARLLLVLVAASSLTACLNSTTLVKLKPDGSGTVEQTTLVNMAAIKGMAGGQSSAPMTSREELERTAARMGKGVRLLSTEPIKGANGFEGTKAIFTFDDINLVEVSQDPNMGGGSGRGKSESPVKFNFTRSGGTSTLTIDITDRPGSGKPPEPSTPTEMPDLTNPMIMGMIKSMFQGFKVNLDLEVVALGAQGGADFFDVEFGQRRC